MIFDVLLLAHHLLIVPCSCLIIRCVLESNQSIGLRSISAHGRHGRPEFLGKDWMHPLYAAWHSFPSLLDCLSAFTRLPNHQGDGINNCWIVTHPLITVGCFPISRCFSLKCQLCEGRKSERHHPVRWSCNHRIEHSSTNGPLAPSILVMLCCLSLSLNTNLDMHLAKWGMEPSFQTHQVRRVASVLNLA